VAESEAIDLKASSTTADDHAGIARWLLDRKLMITCGAGGFPAEAAN
jgi:hypothetical protein